LVFQDIFGVDDHWSILHFLVPCSIGSIVDGRIGLHLRLSLPVEEAFEEASGEIGTKGAPDLFTHSIK